MRMLQAKKEIQATEVPRKLKISKHMRNVLKKT